jgi:SAM-dependent methyltransferase
MSGWKDFFTNRKTLELFFISVLALYIELLLIRWISSEIRIFAYFQNIVLISCFMGLGLGCALAEKIERKQSYSFFLLFLLTGFAGPLGLTYIIFTDPRQYYLLGSFFGDKSPMNIGTTSAPMIIFAIIIIITIFFLSVDAFFTLGLKLGRLLNQFKPIVAYTINIAGSLIGVLFFTALSALWLPPWVWLIIAAIGLIYFYPRIGIPVTILAIVVTAHSVFFVKHNITWSPYYKIHLIKNTDGDFIKYNLLINNDIFQHGLNMDPEKLIYKVSHYNFIYDLANKKPEDVLIVGAGMGNDAASALIHDARHVDAVEIDPAILHLGKKYHPQDPYNSPKVKTYVEDARAFFKKTKKKYDFVIFGTLDSHMVLSSFSSIRIDNYVYTTESLKEAYSLLKEDGVFAVTFFATTDWLCQRIYKTIKEVSGEEPVILSTKYNNFVEYTFLTGSINKELLKDYYPEYIKIKDMKNQKTDIALTTDNWPFLFLEKPGIPIHYILPLLLLISLSGIVIFYLIGKTESGFDTHMFFLGVAFMMLQVKAIAKLSLVFGSTWVVNSVVIAMILFLILLANLLIYKFPKINSIWAYGLLFITIIIDYMVPANILADASMLARGSVNAIIACMPVFFAAIIFANSFSIVKKPNTALGSNLFGAMIGGALEYISMATGIRFLAIIVIFIYLLSLITINKRGGNISNNLKTG